MYSSRPDKQVVNNAGNQNAGHAGNKGMKWPAVKPLQGIAEKQLISVSYHDHNSSKPVQRKISIGKKAYESQKEDAETIKLAAADIYHRDYISETEMKDHLVNNNPVPVGLIKNLALWYRIPQLMKKEFFVLGESHAAVIGPDIKKASNIKEPILYEAYESWSVKDFEKMHPKNPEKDHGLDERSSKLYRALEMLTNRVKNYYKKKKAMKEGADLPLIEGEEGRARDEEYGSHRLAIKSVGEETKWWKFGDEEKLEKTDVYDSSKEAYNAVEGLYKLVVPEKGIGVFENKLGFIKSLFNSPKDVLNKRLLNYAGIAVNDLLNLTKEIVAEEYNQFYINQDEKVNKSPKDISEEKGADEYRNEFILSSILKGVATDAFSFASVGDEHLKMLRERLSDKKINTISKAEFYSSEYSQDAV
jgi:hypothetical protein